MAEPEAYTLIYQSKSYGDVVLIRWASGDVSILRDMAGAGAPISTTISKECLGKIDELREKQADEITKFSGTWTHPQGGTIYTETIAKTKPASMKTMVRKKK